MSYYFTVFQGFGKVYEFSLDLIRASTIYVFSWTRTKYTPLLSPALPFEAVENEAPRKKRTRVVLVFCPWLGGFWNTPRMYSQKKKRRAGGKHACSNNTNKAFLFLDSLEELLDVILRPLLASYACKRLASMIP